MVSHKRHMAALKAVRTKKRKYGKDMVSSAGAAAKRRKLRRHRR